MSNNTTETRTTSNEQPDLNEQTPPTTERTAWQRLATAEPIEIRDPLAELLGMVPEGDPLVVTFAEVGKHAGHACPAVAGAYRSTQLALDELYPDAYPVRSDITVVVEDNAERMGTGPMASVISHITGAADETGFTGFGGYGGRKNLLSFEDAETSERTFVFTRNDTDETVRMSFSPGTTGAGPPGDDETTSLLPVLISGDATDEQKQRFYDEWHGRVQRVLDASPGPESPFAIETDPE